MDKYVLIGILIAVSVVVLTTIVILIVVFSKKNKGKQPRIKLNDEFITNLLSLFSTEWRTRSRSFLK